MKMIKVDVTSNHIRNGQRGVKSTCPVALAILDAMNMVEMNRYKVAVCGDSFNIHDCRTSETFHFRAPGSVGKFVESFDAYGMPPPFQFEFDFDLKGVYRFPYPHVFFNYDYGYNIPSIKITIEKPKLGMVKIPLELKVAEWPIESKVKESSEVKDVKLLVEPTKKEIDEFVSKYLTDPALQLITA